MVVTALLVSVAGVHAQAGYVYMSNFQRIYPETDDTEAIRRAIAAIESGTVVFDENKVYDVRETINLREKVTLQGSTRNTTGTGFPESPSLILFTPNSTYKSLFKVDANTFMSEITIKNLGLKATSSTDSVGFEATGVSGDSIFGVTFRDVEFSGFHYGIKASDGTGTSSWQFDNVSVQNCTFVVPTSTSYGSDDARHAAIYVDSTNSGWRISNTTIGVGQHSIGVYFKRGSYTTIDSLISNGPLQVANTHPSAQSRGYTAVLVKKHGLLMIRNSVSEGVVYDVKVDDAANPRLEPINLISNSFQGLVLIEGASVTSIGNQFRFEQSTEYSGELEGQGEDGFYWDPDTDDRWFRSPAPIAGSNAFVTSIGDRFCHGAAPANVSNNPSEVSPPWCKESWATESNGAVTVDLGMFANRFNSPNLFLNYSDVYFPIDYSDSGAHVDRPMFSIMADTGATRPLLRLGFRDSTYNYHYEIQRNGGNGYLEFKGNQGGSNTGYDFNGPVKLPSYTVSTLPTPQGDGSLAFCSDCTSGTNLTCAGSGNGALALSDGGAWICK